MARRSKLPYTVDTLHRLSRSRVYTGEQLAHLAFPLGGLGTGCLTLSGYGKIGAEGLFDESATGRAGIVSPGAAPAMAIALTTQTGRTKPAVRLLQGKAPTDGGSMPRFEETVFVGAYPFAQVKLQDKQSPLDVTLEAFSPFIPLDPEASSLPVACLMVTLRNPGKTLVKATLNVTLRNMAVRSAVGAGDADGEADSANGVVRKLAIRGLTGSLLGEAANPAFARSLALASPHEDADVPPDGDAAAASGVAGGLILRASLPAGEEMAIPIWVAWHAASREIEAVPHEASHYAGRFADAGAVMKELHASYTRLERETRSFSRALHGSTLPEAVRDAVSASLATLKATTHPFRSAADLHSVTPPDQQALAWLFPALDRAHRDARFEEAADGRLQPTLETPVDAYLMGVLEVYRDWLLAGDDDWLRECLPRVQQIFADTWALWDQDRDGIMEARQRTRAGLDLYGPNTVTGSVYLAALRAAEEMALQLGETDQAELYREIFEHGHAWLDAVLFNGEWFAPYPEPWPTEDGVMPELPDGEPPCLNACLSDQLVGQWQANLLKLGPLLGTGTMRAALASIWVNNLVLPDSRSAKAKPRPKSTAAVATAADEKDAEIGLLHASWPQGNAPATAFAGAGRLRPDAETQVASLLIAAGLVDEGLTLVQAQRDRYDGRRRNPWDAGSDPAERVTSSFALLLTLMDFFYSAPAQSLHLAPKLYTGNFECLFVVPSAWGTVSRRDGDDDIVFQVLLEKGELTLQNLSVGVASEAASVSLGERTLAARGEPTDVGTLIRLQVPVKLKAGVPLILTVPRPDVDDLVDDGDDEPDSFFETDDAGAGSDDDNEDLALLKKIAPTIASGVGLSPGLPVALAPELAEELSGYDLDAALADIGYGTETGAVDRPLRGAAAPGGAGGHADSDDIEDDDDDEPFDPKALFDNSEPEAWVWPSEDDDDFDENDDDDDELGVLYDDEDIDEDLEDDDDEDEDDDED